MIDVADLRGTVLVFLLMFTYAWTYISSPLQ
jgi:hypothetical protein